MNHFQLIDKLEKNHHLSHKEYIELMTNLNEEEINYLKQKASQVREKIYQKDVYLRGIIEFTNYCHNDCFYCGIRKSNTPIHRYRLTNQEIIDCADLGYALGFRTIVLQGGEDDYYKDEDYCKIIQTIKKRHPDIAITLSIGEKSYSSYLKYYQAGADRYLLRHETINPVHYSKLHPPYQTLNTRIQALKDLKEIGYQVGCGMMIGSPFQTLENICEDLDFIESFEPHMVGIGPFITHHQTPFKDYPSGSLSLTLILLSIIRLIHPHVLLPATTALGTLDRRGREKGILHGCNVIMPNLSPLNIRKDYMLYDNKICVDETPDKCFGCMDLRMDSIGYHIKNVRGDFK